MAAGGAGGAGGGGHSGAGMTGDYRTDVNEQIAVALVRLQQDMTSVLTRLHTLESLQLAQSQVSGRLVSYLVSEMFLF